MPTAGWCEPAPTRHCTLPEAADVSEAQRILGVPSLAEHKTPDCIGSKNEEKLLYHIKRNLAASHFQEWFVSSLTETWIPSIFLCCQLRVRLSTPSVHGSQFQAPNMTISNKQKKQFPLLYLFIKKKISMGLSTCIFHWAQNIHIGSYTEKMEFSFFVQKVKSSFFAQLTFTNFL